MIRAPSLHRQCMLAIAGVIVLVGCTAVRSDGRSLLTDSAKREPSAELSLRVLEKSTDGTFRVGIVIANPHREAVTSVRSWVSFHSETITIDALRKEDERFSLVAPGEWEISSGEGLVKIGAATPAAIRDGEILLASFRAAVVPESSSSLTFYDWRADGKGHTTALEVSSTGEVTPLLLPPTSILLP